MDKLLKKQNLLLVKDDVGKAKPCTIKLPEQGFAFGKADDKSQEGVGAITSSWMTHNNSKSVGKFKDFKKINKLGINHKGDLNVSYSIFVMKYISRDIIAYMSIFFS